MDDLEQLEKDIQDQYTKNLKPLANQLAVNLSRSEVDAPRLPMVLFLGNHSSGKSTFINYLIDEERQKTGLAPTDDGFTILINGQNRDELDGQSAVSDPTLALGRLEKLGPTFLSLLRVKLQKAEILEKVTLVDSPGMIDAAASAEGRGYDFQASVREFAEMADLILFFFDPDKPGTTGETVSIFNQQLAGMEHKLLIVLNKVDLFGNIRDFARTYGTLCWNLSKTMRTKDVPHIFNTYVPVGPAYPENPDHTRLPLEDFDQSRAEVEAEIHRAPTRRVDNLVSDLLQESRRLTMQARVGEAVVHYLRTLKAKFYGGGFACLIAGAVGTYFTLESTHWAYPAACGAGGALLALGLFIGGRIYTKRRARHMHSAKALDPYFEKVYLQELTWQDRSDLRALWDQVQPKLLNAIALKGADKLPTGIVFKRKLRRVEKVIEIEVPNLRRELIN